MTITNKLHRRDLMKLAGATALSSATAVSQSFGAPRPAGSKNREFVIRGAHALTMEPGMADLPRGDIHVRDGVIVAIGASVEAPHATVIEGAGHIVMPGFVDTHWHMQDTFLRGYVRADAPVDGYFPLMTRLGPYCTPDDAYKSVRFAVAQGFLSGLTTVHDWTQNIVSPQHADAELQALTDCGVRARFSYGTAQNTPRNQQMDLADVARVQNQWARHDGMLSIGAALRAPGFGTRGDTVVVTVDLIASEAAILRKLGVPLTIHSGGKDIVATLAPRGMLGSDMLLVHLQHKTPEELQAVADTKTSYSIAPLIEMSYSSARDGDIQFAEAEALHIPLCLSVDSAAAAASTDYFLAMRALLWSNWRRPDVSLKLENTPKRLVELATIDGARALGMGDITGSLRVGKRADLITIRKTDFNIAPVVDPYYALVFAAQPANIDLVVANGRIVVQGGKLAAFDLDQTIREAGAAADALVARAPKG